MINSSTWNQFLIHEKGSFLQSWEWGEFQKSLGKKIWRLQFQNSELLGQVLVIKENLPLHLSFLYVPFGPTILTSLSLRKRKEVLQFLFDQMRRIGEKERLAFVRIEPLTILDWGFAQVKKSLKRHQPQQSLILNLQGSLEEIFKNFSVRSRYNIRLAKRKNLKILRLTDQTSTESPYFSSFAELITKTAQRKNFHAYPKKYYLKLLSQSLSQKWGELFLAEYQKKIIGGYLVIFFNQQATCLHGAVDYRYRALKPSHLLQWEQIKAAKDKGYTSYDFWGIDEKQWPGVTFFKKSFGGETIIYPPSLEIPFNRPLYAFYSQYQKLRKR